MRDEVLSLLFSLIGILLILFGCYLFSKFAAKKINSFSNTQNIKILEKVPLSQDKGLALAQICGKYYLIGFSSQTIELLKELSESDLSVPPKSGPKSSFLEVLQEVGKNGWSVKSFDEDKGTMEAGKKGTRRNKDKENP
ncbi:FliO/MopB family protein [Clostridium minihomine]|uniref:FliO/MopB family protein n=1 Tax=Clostridium minihomine TaxID=2045012 RepID=UPI000C77E6D9|nr:flagellar biosynthetic protein FliO [Clostridium minihomine]